MSKITDLLREKQGLVPEALPSASPATSASGKQHGPTLEQQQNPLMKPEEASPYEVIKPIRSSADEVLFHSFHPNMSYFYKNARRSFRNGYLAISDSEEINWLKENFCKHPAVSTPRMEIVEEGSLDNPEASLLEENSGHPTPDVGQFGQK